jgi:Flp pilus assembly protein TadD
MSKRNGRADVGRTKIAFGLIFVSAVSCLFATDAVAQSARPRRAASANGDAPTRDAAPPQTRARRAAPSNAKTSAPTKARLIIRTEPRAVVWIDDIRRGVTDDAGTLAIEKIAPTPDGTHTVRVRAQGFAEKIAPLGRRSGGVFEIKLAPTTDEAELTFQKAEALSERATNDDERAQAIALYRQVLKLRPRFAQAHIGLARALLASEDYNGALNEVKEARKIRPVYPEASAIEGRALRQAADEAAAIRAYQRAIREARGFQPEAYTGLAIIYDEQGKYKEAVAAYQKALAQLSDSEPLVYQLLGSTYEKLENYKQAVAAYENYLRLAPNGKLAPAIQSVIDQLRQQAADQARGGSGAPPP